MREAELEAHWAVGAWRGATPRSKPRMATRLLALRIEERLGSLLGQRDGGAKGRDTRRGRPLRTRKTANITYVM
jgi:hypothetical protein